MREIIKDFFENLRKDGRNIYLGKCEKKKIYIHIIRDVHDGHFPNSIIFKTIYAILKHFYYNIEMLKDKSRNEQVQSLFVMLNQLQLNKSYIRLLNWVAEANFDYYVDDLLRRGFRFSSLYELLQQAYRNFVQEIGSRLISALVKYSDIVNQKEEDYEQQN